MVASSSSNEWARGTIASLVRRSKGEGPRITTQQLIADLRAENARLADQLADARAIIARLEQTLAVYEATSGQDRLLNITEAARLLQVHPSSVSRWVAAGHFKLYTQAGKKPLIYESSLHRPSPKRRGRKGKAT